MTDRGMQLHPDGPLDRRIDTSHLCDSRKKDRQTAYETWKVKKGTITTAAGQLLNFDLGRKEDHVKFSKLRWKVDGQVSVAQISCQRCAEINSCREEGAPPFICLVRAYDNHIRDDGTSFCALCFCHGKSADCDAVKAIPTSSSTKSNSQSIAKATLQSKKRPKARQGVPRRRSSSESDDSDICEVFTVSEESEEESVARAISSSGRKIRPVNRYNAAEATAGGSSMRNPASTSTSVHNGSTNMPRDPDGDVNSGIVASSSSSSKQENVDESNLKKSIGGKRLREIRQRCIKTASQLLTLELAELEAEITKEDS